MATGLFPQLKSHIILGKEHGIMKEDVVEIVTQFAFYSGWPKAWSAFPIIEEVYGSDSGIHGGVFGMGDENTAFSKYFIGRSYLKPLNSNCDIFLANVTFEPRCRNNWHIHHAKKGGGQILICVEGSGNHEK